MSVFEEELSPDVLVGFAEADPVEADTTIEDELRAMISTGGVARAVEIHRSETPKDHSEANPDRSNEVFSFVYDEEAREAIISSRVTDADYEKITHPEDWQLIQDQGKILADKSVVFINCTRAGGGVVLLRPPTVIGLRHHGMDAHWNIMSVPDQEKLGGNPFEVTKMTHNTLQRVLPEGTRVTPELAALHEDFAYPEGDHMATLPVVKNADIIVIDDPQPSPMLRKIMEANPTAKIIFRWHIDLDGKRMDDPTTPQGEIADRILNKYGVRQAKAFVYHPVEQFVIPSTADRSYFAPATTEPHDDLNRELTLKETEEGFNFINAEIIEKNNTLSPERQIPLMDPNKKRILLVARFDESKGMEHAMEMGAQTRRAMRAQGVAEEELPEVVIIGNGSIDDPSGIPMYEKMSQLRLDTYADEADGIILMRLKHNYQAMNAIMRKSHVLLQTSIAEGCETRISDGIEHGLPAIVFNIGGMPAQVIEGKSGFVLDFNAPGHDLERGTAIITDLMMNPDKHAALVETTKEHAEIHNRRNYTTMANVARWQRIFINVLEGKPADHLWLMQDLVAEHKAEKAKRMGEKALA